MVHLKRIMDIEIEGNLQENHRAGDFSYRLTKESLFISQH